MSFYPIIREKINRNRAPGDPFREKPVKILWICCGKWVDKALRLAIELTLKVGGPYVTLYF